MSPSCGAIGARSILASNLAQLQRQQLVLDKGHADCLNPVAQVQLIQLRDVCTRMLSVPLCRTAISI